MTQYNTLQYEDKQLANIFLENNYYKAFRKGEKAIELFLIGACKANCQYCYLKKNVKDLYPLHLHNNDIILSNLKKLLNWYVDNKFCCDFDIFSAEWLTTPLADKVINLFEEVFSQVDVEYRPKNIIMADNVQFLKSDKYTQKVEEYIDRLAKLNIQMYISASVDGKYCEYNRTECTDEYYQKLYNFCSKYQFKPHPMISSDNIKYWINNYRWWRENFGELSQELMTLEIRDNTWTDESIGQLIQYCDFLMDYKWKELNENKIEFIKYIFDLHEACGEERINSPYNIISLCNRGAQENRDCVTCSNYGNLSIRLGDLSFAPCHRLFYPELEYGKFNADDRAIIDFEPTNVSLLIAYKRLKKGCLPYCEECSFNCYCVGHCHGLSHEQYGNPFVPPMETCRMYKAKLSFLIYKCYTLNLFDKEGLSFLKKYMQTLEYAQFKELTTTVLGSMGIYNWDQEENKC